MLLSRFGQAENLCSTLRQKIQYQSHLSIVAHFRPLAQFQNSSKDGSYCQDNGFSLVGIDKGPENLEQRLENGAVAFPGARTRVLRLSSWSCCKQCPEQHGSPMTSTLKVHTSIHMEWVWRHKKCLLFCDAGSCQVCRRLNDTLRIHNSPKKEESHNEEHSNLSQPFKERMCRLDAKS